MTDLCNKCGAVVSGNYCSVCGTKLVETYQLSQLSSIKRKANRDFTTFVKRALGADRKEKGLIASEHLAASCFYFAECIIRPLMGLNIYSCISPERFNFEIKKIQQVSELAEKLFCDIRSTYSYLIKMEE